MHGVCKSMSEGSIVGRCRPHAKPAQENEKNEIRLEAGN